MANGDRIHIPQSRLPTLLENARNHPVYGKRYRGMDDWEVYQDIKQNFSQYDLEDAPPEWRSERISKIMQQRGYDVGSFDNPKEPLKRIETTKGATGGYFKRAYFSGLGVINVLPKYISESVKLGANESVSGLASHIATGEAPFNLEGSFHPDMVQNAIGFAAGMLYDWYMFMNPLTAGSAATVKLASGPAKKQAAESLSKYFLGQQLERKIGQEGYKTLTAAHLQRAMKEPTRDGAKKYLFGNGILRDSNRFDSMSELSLNIAKHEIDLSVGAKQWYQSGVQLEAVIAGKSFREELLPKPSLRRIVSAYGTQSAKALGVYSAVQNAEMQIVAGLKKRYPYGAENILKRYKKTGEWVEDSIDPSQVIYSFAHGYLGGFVAGGLSGVRAAGRAGAFKKGNFDKWMTKSHPRFREALYNGWKADAGWITAEGLGFTLAGKVTDSAAKAVGMDIEPHPFGDTLLQNLATITVMRGMHSGLRKLRGKAKEPLEKMEAIFRRRLAELKKNDGVKTGLDVKNEYEAATLATINEKLKLDIRSMEGLNGEVKQLAQNIDRIFERIRQGKASLTDINNAKDYKAQWDIIAKEFEPIDVDRRSFDAEREKISRFLENYDEIMGRFEDGVADAKFANEGPAVETRKSQVLRQDLRDYKKMVDEGLITQADYNRKKKELLGEYRAEESIPTEKEPTKAGIKEINEAFVSDVINYASIFPDGSVTYKVASKWKSKEQGWNNIGKTEKIKEENEAGINWLLMAHAQHASPKSGKLFTAFKNTLKRLAEIMDKDGKSILNLNNNYIKKYSQGFYRKRGTVGTADKPIVSVEQRKQLNHIIDAVLSRSIEVTNAKGNKITLDNPFENIVSKAAIGKGQTQKISKDKITYSTRDKALTQVKTLWKKEKGRLLEATEQKNFPHDITFEKSKDKKYDDIVIHVPRSKKGKMTENPTSSIDSNIPSLLYHWYFQTGGRTIGLTQSEVKGQNPLRIKDIEFSTASDGTKKLTYSITEKGKAFQDSKKYVLYNIQYADGINPYQTFKKIYDRRISEIPGKSPEKSSSALLVTRLRASGKVSKEIKTYDQIATLMRATGLLTGVKKDGRFLEEMHTVRNLWTDTMFIIDGKITGQGTRRGHSSWFSEFVDSFMLTHDYTTKTFKYYLSEPSPERVGATIRLVNEIVAKELAGKISDSKDINKIVDIHNAKFIKLEEGRGDGLPLVSYEGQILPRAEGVSALRGGAKGKQQQRIGLSRGELVSDKELINHVLNEVEKNPGTTVNFLRGKKYAAEIIGNHIDIVLGKADLTSWFHESSHLLKRVAYESGDKRLIQLWERGERMVEKWAKERDSERWNLFVEQYGNKKGTSPAEEYLAQRAAEWSLKKQQATGIAARLRVWAKQWVSRLKSMLGIHNAKDVSRIWGDIVEKGYSSKGFSLKGGKMRQKSMEPEPEADYVTKKETDALKKFINEKGWSTDPETIYLTMAKHLGLEHLSIDRLTVPEYNGLMDVLESIEIRVRADGTANLGRPKTWQGLNRKIHAVRDIYGWTDALHERLLSKLQVHKQDLKWATEKQLQRYIQFVEEHGKSDWGYHGEFLIDKTFARELGAKDKFLGFIQTKLGRGAMPVDYVLRKIGASKLADRMLEHYRYESIMRGEGSYRIGNALRLIKSKDLNNKMAYVLDPELQKGANLDDATKSFIRKATTDKQSNEHKAYTEIRKLYDFYWDTLKNVAKENIRNPRELEKWLEENNRSYVEGYFTRSLSKEAKDYFNIGPNYERLVQKQFNSLVNQIVSERNMAIKKLAKDYENATSTVERNELKSQIRSMEKERDKTLDASANRTGREYQRLRLEAEQLLDSLMGRERNIVRNVYLLKRRPKFDNIIVNDKTGKEMNVYETNFETQAGKYISSMSNYLATAKHFPNFTNIKTKYVGDRSPGERLNVLSKHGKSMGAYVELALRRRIGLEPVDHSKEFVETVANQAGYYSALFGLSSPLSGTKNWVIGTAMGTSILGMRNYLRSIARMLSPSRETKDAKDLIRRTGAEQAGTKELELTGVSDFMMKRVSLMKPSEAANRFTSAYAGLLTAEQLVSRLRGEGWTMMPRTSPTKAKEKLKSLFNLSEKEIMFLQNHGFKKGEHAREPGQGGNRINDMMQNIRDKVIQYSHIITQGATAEPFLPLWAQNRTARNLTLFYRMAYSGTANVSKHIFKPALKGDIMPAARYLFAGQVLGGALWSIYAQLLGTAKPSENENFWKIMMMNMSKAETLGLFSFLLSPYQNKWQASLRSDSIMQPAIIRNFEHMRVLFYNQYLAAKGEEIDSVDELEKALKSMIPLVSHVTKAYQNVKNPYKTKINTVKTFKKAWMKHTGLWEYEGKDESYDPNSPTSAYYNLIREAFYANDMDTAAKYYLATKLYLWDHYRTFQGREHFYEDEVRSRVGGMMSAMVTRMNPMHFTDDSGKRAWSKEKEFKNYLTDDNKKLAKAVNDEFYYRMRKGFVPAVRKNTPEFMKTWDDGHIIDMFPVPPKGYFFLGFGQWDNPWSKIRSKTAQMKESRKKNKLDNVIQ